MRAVELAIDNAAPAEVRYGGWMPLEAPRPELGRPEIGPDAPHDYPVKYPDYDEDILPKHWVVTQTPRDLRDSILAFHKIFNLPLLPKVLREINKEVKHESQHGQGMMALGAHATHYALMMLKRETPEGIQHGCRTTYAPFSLRTTKLGDAIIAAYPDVPSPTDVRRIRTLGYWGTREVGQLARQYSMPVPLSTRPGRQRLLAVQRALWFPSHR